MELLSSCFLYTTTSTIIFFFFLFLVPLPTHSTSQTAADVSYYYETCAPSVCGNVTATFPFSSSDAFCRLPDFAIDCNSSSNLFSITISGRPYQVKSIYRSDTLLVVSDVQLAQQLRSNTCDEASLRDHFLLAAASFGPFRLPDWIIHLNFSWCRRGDLPLNFFTSVAVDYGCGGNYSLYLLNETLGGYLQLPAACVHAWLPVHKANLPVNFAHRDEVVDVINGGFVLLWDNVTACWDCEATGGRCGYNQTDGKVTCFPCNDRCGGDKKSSWKIILAVVAPAATFFFLLLLGLFRFRKKASSLSSSLCFHINFGKRNSGSSSNIKEFISNYKSTLPTEYSYSDLRKITDGFKEKLGEGGFGSVYKGKLPNGLPVAAKVLERSKDNGEDFVNEVATIGRIHHVNIIRLLGFCCDRSRRALIYELMSRGSLADLITSEKKSSTRRNDQLGARQLLDIALGIARGVDYLHNGCEKRILHLDIKPRNVLLDGNLQPKISDFGLAKSYSRKESVVTLTGARGTVGYIAPEVFMRSLGGVSHKSDVYSFGMLLLEMAVGKKEDVESEQSGSSGKYFHNWIYDKLQEWVSMEGGYMDDGVVVDQEDVGILRKMVMVGLWCIQTDPLSRPSIAGALEMLKGAVECIDMPPKPILFSMPKQRAEDTSLAYSDHGLPPDQTSYYTFETG